MSLLDCITRCSRWKLHSSQPQQHATEGIQLNEPQESIRRLSGRNLMHEPCLITSRPNFSTLKIKSHLPKKYTTFRKQLQDEIANAGWTFVCEVLRLSSDDLRTVP